MINKSNRILALKEVTLRSLDRMEESSVLKTHRDVHHYMWGLSLGLNIARKLTKEEHQKFNEWLMDKTTVTKKIKTNVGTFFRPKYKEEVVYNWRKRY